MTANEARNIADDFKVSHVMTILAERARLGFYDIEQPIPLTLDQLTILTNRGYSVEKVVGEDNSIKYKVSFKTNVYTRR